MRPECLVLAPMLLAAACLAAQEPPTPADGPLRTLSWDELKAFLEPPAEFTGKMGAYRSVLKFDDGTEVKTPADWPRRRKEILDYWHKAMGPWPATIDKPAIKYTSKERVEGLTRHKVSIQVAEKQFVDAYLLVPDGEGPFPAVLVVFYDAATGAGLNEPRREALGFGYHLAKRGFVTLNVGGVSGPQEVQPLSYLAYVAANCANLLASLPEVDAKRIAVMGHSFGGKWAMLASCLCEKFACAVWVDPGIVWNEKDANANYWERWYLGFDANLKEQRKPGIPSERNPRTGAYKRLVEEGRDLHELHALMAPRPFLVSGGAQDRPDHWAALNHAIALNRLLGFENRVGMTMRDGHTPTPESNLQAYSFLAHCLAKRDR